MGDVTSAPSASRSVPVSAPGWWLKSVINPALNMQIDVEDFSNKIEEKQAVFRPLGRSRPLVVSDGTTGYTGALNVSVIGEIQSAQLRALIESTQTLLLQSPYGEQYYVRLTGERTKTIASGGASTAYYNFAFTFTEVDKP